MQIPKNFLWVALGALVLLLAYTIGKQGGFLEELSVGKEGLHIKMKQIEALPREELTARQGKLNQQLEAFDASLQQNNGRQPQNNSSTATTVPLSVNLNGAWDSNVGTAYQITQSGNEIVISEFVPGYGVTAVGTGELHGNVATIAYQTLLNTVGRGELHIANDGASIQATFHDQTTGAVTKVLLTR